MVVFRGWGLVYFVVPFFVWMAIAIAGSGMASGDGKNGDFFALMSGAVALAVSAALLWPISRYRDRVAPGRDHLAFIPAKYCIYLFLAGAVGVSGWALITKA